MLVTGSITRIQNRPFGALFFTKCCRKGTNPGDCTTFDRYAGIDGSEDAREDAAGPIDVCATAVAESVQHHSLFPADAAKKQNPKADHAGKQQCLSDSPTR
jgi:hypothetical protein